MSRVFICYSHEDSAFVSELAAALKADGVSIWWDVDDIPEQIGIHTQRWWDAALDGLKQCNHMIVVLSPDSANSRELAALWTYSLQQGKQVLPVVYRDCDIPDRLAVLEWWDFRGDIEPPFDDLLEVLPRDAGEDIPPAEHLQEAEPESARGLMTLPTPAILLVMVLGVLVLGGLVVLGVYWLGNSSIVDDGLETVRAWGEAMKNPTQEPIAAPTNIPTPITVQPVSKAQFRQVWELAIAGLNASDQWQPFVVEIDGVQMALVPAGCFMMGSEDGDENESPMHGVCFEQPFWIDVYEVTNEQHGLPSVSTRGGDCWEKSSQDDQPQVCVRWFDARTHCESRGARLPTEAEWEYAARGPDGLIYPWGNTFNGDYVVYHHDDGADLEVTGIVGARPDGISWVGAYDLSGNVSEWTDDAYQEDYYSVSPDINPQGPFVGVSYVHRGGSWASDSFDVRASARFADDPTEAFNDVGFRCALSYDLAPEEYRPAVIPTSTPQPTLIPTPLPTPTIVTPIVPSEIDLRKAGQLALAGVSGNDEWEAIVYEFDGVPMALVPTGCFMMGSEDGQRNEEPVHEVCFDKPFWIDVYEVTNGQYGWAAAVEECLDKSSEDDQPRICIHWIDAAIHCESRGARLPTEAEWEYAARGPDSLIYPWGNEFIPENVVYYDRRLYPRTTMPVGSVPGGVSWVGAYDMSGNVWDMVNDWYSSFDDASPVVNPLGPESGDTHSVRGGSWVNGEFHIRAATRSNIDAGALYADRGFRCARSYDG